MALTEEGLVRVPGLASRFVRLGSGAKAHYVTSGDTGPAVVLLHGGIIGSSGTAGWRFMAPFLGENGFRVYCPDMPGFGLTDGYDDLYKPGRAGNVDFLHDFVTAVCLDKFHLAGNSMGCMNTVNYVVAHPERILSFALIAGHIGDLLPMKELAKLDTRPREARPVRNFDGSAESMRTMMESIIARPEAISDDLVQMRTLAANRQREAYERQTAGGFGASDPLDNVRLSTKGRLDQLELPAIYLYGREDVLLPVELAYPQEDVLPHVQFFYPEETGHQGQTDQPEMFNQVFLEFFRDGIVSRKTADWAGVSTRRPELPNLVSAK